MLDAYQGRMATRYDALWRTFTARMLAPVVALAQGTLAPAARVLDVGCGTGVLLAQLLAQHPHLVAVGADGSDAMLAQARLRLGSRVQLATWDLDRDPPPSVSTAGPFNLITCTNVAHYLRAPGRTMQMLRQLLAPDGQIIMADFIRHGWWWPGFEVLLHSTDRAHRHTLTTQGLTQLVQESGFTIQLVQLIVVNTLWHGAAVLGRKMVTAPY